MDRTQELERELRDVKRCHWRMRVAGLSHLYWLITALTYGLTLIIANVLGYGSGTLPRFVLAVVFLVVSIFIFVKGEDIAEQHLVAKGNHPPR